MNRKLDKLLSLTKAVGGIEAAMKHIAAKYDQILADVKKHDNEIKNIKSRVQKVELTRTDDEL